MGMSVLYAQLQCVDKQEDECAHSLLFHPSEWTTDAIHRCRARIEDLGFDSRKVHGNNKNAETGTGCLLVAQWMDVLHCSQQQVVNLQQRRRTVQSDQACVSSH